MQDEALQAAFEIKTECDEISRRLLRWHWEQKPGSHSLDALLRHIAQRQKESPDYYDRMELLNRQCFCSVWQSPDAVPHCYAPALSVFRCRKENPPDGNSGWK